jgi:uncharacterized protein (DUF58 family)
MPTVRGWLVGLSGLGALVAGIAFGARPVQQVGVGLMVLPIAAVAVVHWTTGELRAIRSISPPRVHAGRPVTVSLELHNRSRSKTPLLLLEDRLPWELSGRARFAIQGLEGGGTRRASLSVAPPRRGKYVVGPLLVSVLDPFSLAQSRREMAGDTEFLVYPKAERLALPRDLGEQRSIAVSTLKQPTGARGEDFYTLREYVEGDDLRKVSWPATAKRGRYMIRQEETPWHTRATILLDDREEAYRGSGSFMAFERAIETTAAVVDLYGRTGYTFRLSTALNAGLKHSRGTDHTHRCLELLATCERHAKEDAFLVRLAELESGGSAEGTFVCVAGDLTPAEAHAIVRCRRRFRQIIVVVAPEHRYGAGTTRGRWERESATVEVSRLLAKSGVRCLVLGPDEPLTAVWAGLSSGRGSAGEDRWELKPERA